MTLPSNFMKTRIFFSVALAAAGAATVSCSSPKPASVPTPQPSAPNTGRVGGPPTAGGVAGQDTGRGGVGAQAPLPAQPRPYNRVITADAKTRRGMFTVHRVGDRLYFEIPAQGAEQGRAARRPLRARGGGRIQTPGPGAPGFGEYAGDEFAERTLRWERNGNRVVLRSPSFAITADTALVGLPLGPELELRSDHRRLQRRRVRAGQRGRSST